MIIKRPFEYWESGRTIDYITYPTPFETTKLSEYYFNNIERIQLSPKLNREAIDKYKLEAIKSLVSVAYEHTEVYRDKYKEAGITPLDIKTLSDFERIPPITKKELIDAFPNRCVDHINHEVADLFGTRSSGSSGQVVRLLYDREAVHEDTLHGIRQWTLQSGERYRSADKVAMIYTCPWWFREVDGGHASYFISSLIDKEKIISILIELQPHIISCYPSMLDSLASYLDGLNNLYLIVVHSEQSTKKQRGNWSKLIGVPVLDEYSSEEATRISLELPCGHYHVCEDTVHLESLDPHTLLPSKRNAKGLATVTNLLNRAMPIIRYIQGDVISLSDKPCTCGLSWQVMNSISGRANDSFITLSNKTIDSGVLLDLTYRWMMETDVNVSDFVLTQLERNVIQLSLTNSDYLLLSRDIKRTKVLEDWLETVMEHPISLRLERNLFANYNKDKKRKPIRSLVTEKCLTMP